MNLIVEITLIDVYRILFLPSKPDFEKDEWGRNFSHSCHVIFFVSQEIPDDSYP